MGSDNAIDAYFNEAGALTPRKGGRAKTKKRT